MRWILIVALFAMTAYGNQGFTSQQKLCPKGEHWVVKASMKLDKKTGKYIPSGGRPESKCVKVDEKKPEKPKEPKEPEETKEDKNPTVLQIYKYGGSHGTGGSFPSMSSCMEKQRSLTKANEGLDYSYKCVKK